MKQKESQIQATEVKNEENAGVEKEEVTNNVEDEVGASTSHYTRHQFESSRDK